MDKKTQIKTLENELQQLWQQLIMNYYQPLINQKHQQSIIEINKCATQICIDEQLIQREAPIRNLKKITKTYENAIEDCLFNCKYSMALEMDDCYIDCFSNFKKIVNKLHQF